MRRRAVSAEHLTSPGTAARHGGLHVAGASARQGIGCAHEIYFLSARCSTRWRQGTLPFRGESSGVIIDAILDRDSIRAIRLNPDIPPKLEDIINRALEKDRNLRYQHAAEMRAELQASEAGHGYGPSVSSEFGASGSGAGYRLSSSSPSSPLPSSGSVPAAASSAAVRVAEVPVPGGKALEDSGSRCCRCGRRLSRWWLSTSGRVTQRL